MARRHPMLNLRVAFFVPVWRRVLVVALLAVWTLVELVWGNPFWALLAGGIGAYAGWVFFFDFSVDGPDGQD